MAGETISGYRGRSFETVDPDESEDRASKGYTGTSPEYQNAADKKYAPLGKMSTVPDAVPFGVDPDASEDSDPDDDPTEGSTPTSGQASGGTSTNPSATPDTPSSTPSAPSAPSGSTSK